MELVKMVSVLFAAKQIKDTLLPFISECLAKRLKKRWKKTLYKKTIEADPNRKEYLKYTIQFGFITLFASVFPLASLLALINNIVDLRLTARRFLTCYQRPVPQKVQNIGVWFSMMETLTKVAVVVNALIIGFTSEFIPKLVFQHYYNNSQGLSGFTDFSLSTFNLQDLDSESKQSLPVEELVNCKGLCRYADYHTRNKNGVYVFSDTFFVITCAQLLFIICYIVLVSSLLATIRWLIPDIPKKLRWQMERERRESNKLLLKST